LTSDERERNEKAQMQEREKKRSKLPLEMSANERKKQSDLIDKCERKAKGKI